MVTSGIAQVSNNIFADPHRCIVERKVPRITSLLSGTSTVVVSDPPRRCITMWLPLCRVLGKPYRVKNLANLVAAQQALVFTHAELVVGEFLDGVSNQRDLLAGIVAGRGELIDAPAHQSARAPPPWP